MPSKGEEPCAQRDLDQRKEREEHAEIPVLRLVMEFEHADRAADAAKEDREQKEMLFRNAALMRLRQALVCARRLSAPMATKAAALITAQRIK